MNNSLKQRNIRENNLAQKFTGKYNNPFFYKIKQLIPIYLQ